MNRQWLLVGLCTLALGGVGSMGDDKPNANISLADTRSALLQEFLESKEAVRGLVMHEIVALARKEGEHPLVYAATPSYDGRWLAVVFRDKWTSDHLTARIVPVGTDDVEINVTPSVREMDIEYYDPVWSPDSTTVYFAISYYREHSLLDINL